MKHCKLLTIGIPALLLSGAILSADSVTVTLTGAGPVNDGAYYVLPYELSVDGLPTAAVCYDAYDEVQLNQTWQANELTLSEAAAANQFGVDPTVAPTDYEQVAYLASLWFTESLTQQNQIDLQHAIWNVFDPAAAFTITDDSFYAPGLATEQSNGFADVDPGNYVFLQAVAGTDGTVAQSFVYYVPGNNSNQNPTPEPGGLAPVLIGLGLIGISKYVENTRKGASGISRR